MSHHATYADTHRVMGSRTGRMLKGEKPADSPVQQANSLGQIRQAMRPAAYRVAHMLCPTAREGFCDGQMSLSRHPK
jgi:hypothetical protein